MDVFKRDILIFKDLCLMELQKRKEGIEGESTIEQLEKVILPELEDILVTLGKKTFPPREERFLYSFANAFTVWGWNMQNPTEIFLTLNKLNNDYKAF